MKRKFILVVNYCYKRTYATNYCTSTSRHSSQTTTAFCLINVSGRWQSVSCCSRSSVNSLPSHVTAAPSLHLMLSFYHISSHFLIPLSVSSLLCTEPAQWLVILGILFIMVITFYILHF